MYIKNIFESTLEDYELMLVTLETNIVDKMKKLDEMFNIFNIRPKE
jgi:hypothetical protein